MNTVTQFVQNRNTPRQWGFADALAGKSEFEGYDLFAGLSLQAYIDGHHTGQAYARKYAGTLPHLTPPPVVRVRSEVRRLSGGSEQPKAHRKYQEGRDMDQDLFNLRNDVEQPIVRMTDELLEEIENSLF